PDQRSGTSVTARPDEQFAPNKPILSLFALCIDMRSWRDGAGASTVPPEASIDVANRNQASPPVPRFEWDAGTNRLAPGLGGQRDRHEVVERVVGQALVHELVQLDRDAPPSMADIPTLDEAAGLPDLEDISVWLGLVAPKGTPKPIIEKIH